MVLKSFVKQGLFTTGFIFVFLGIQEVLEGRILDSPWFFVVLGLLMAVFAEKISELVK